ncbi:hypothetical protein BMR1_01G00375 [Babesia microti strain RI]|uniref:Uncharacterized protein n=1 Tax=Babesia microti (strain RI) TaxID=1133968 RepID=I7IF70_BABMR|nr:hypothetical protein BMR1_01G00375 [Babesia microti strain RI]CCF72546.1 hypothetical protein BMR1_01G00375 [Babesia microti strain RI]|eukprot:XP_012647155.1 hypothetical protein BMR1_01G00375 [Babesia microti strain RI]
MEINVLGEVSLGGSGIIEAKFDNFGRFLAVLTEDKICTLFDISNGCFTEIIRSQFHPSTLSIAWTNPKFGQYIIASLASGSIHVMKLTISPKLSTISFIGESRVLNEYPSALNVGNTDTDMFIVLGSAGGKIGILSLKTNELTAPFDAHFGGVTALCFDTNCSSLFSIGQDYRLVKWFRIDNSPTWTKIFSIKSDMPMNTIDYSLGEIIASHSSKVFIYNEKGEELEMLDVRKVKVDNGVDLGNNSISKVAFHGHRSIAVALESNVTILYTKDGGDKYKFMGILHK